MLGYCCVFKIDYRNLNNMVYLLIINIKMNYSFGMGKKNIIHVDR